MKTQELFTINLNRLMKLNKKSQIDISKGLNIEKSLIHYWVKGKTMPKPKNIDALSKYFNVEIYEFFMIRN